MTDLTDAQKAVAAAANLLAKTEYEANKTLLTTLTAFLASVETLRDSLGYPESYQSPLTLNLNQITQNFTYIRDSDLPSRIASYESETTTTANASPQP